jgi:outer membrane protein assembly factor BamE (lipoprotein component of BamABCDE complex)
VFIFGISSCCGCISHQTSLTQIRHHAVDLRPGMTRLEVSKVLEKPDYIAEDKYDDKWFYYSRDPGHEEEIALVIIAQFGKWQNEGEERKYIDNDSLCTPNDKWAGPKFKPLVPKEKESPTTKWSVRR